MKIFKIIFRTILIIACLGFLVWLGGKNLVTTGHFNVETDFCEGSKFITYLYPENRISPLVRKYGDCYQKIFVEPAYFRVKIPRTFYKAKVELEYKNTDQDIVKLGIMKKRMHPLDWRFKIKPLENKFFNRLNNWHHIKSNGVSLWQKQKKYSSISEFVHNLPKNEEIIVYNYNFDKEILNKENKLVEWSKGINLNDKEYVIAEYAPPKKLKNGWQKANMEFSVGKTFINARGFEFILSAPGLTEDRKKLSIRNIKVELIRPKTDFSRFLKDFKGFMFRKIRKTLI